jgi:hypothetical protein
VRSDNKLCDGVERWAVPIRHILVLFRDPLSGIGIRGLASRSFPPFLRVYTRDTYGIKSLKSKVLGYQFYCALY